MYTIGADLARNSVGLAIKGSNSLYYSSLELSAKQKDNLSDMERMEIVVEWLFMNMKKYIDKPHTLIIEGIFLQRFGKRGKENVEGFNNIAKTQGAFAYKYYKKTGNEPIFVQAISARKTAGVRVWASKAEIQLFVIDTFKLDNDRIGKEIREKIDTQLNLYKAKGVSNQTLKSRLKKVSQEIKDKTGIDEHIADAIVLTMRG